jgi:hypothetical protein
VLVVAASARWLLAAAALIVLCARAFGFDVAPEPTLTTSRPSDLWLFLPLGYAVSVAVEAPVLALGLSKTLSLRQRLFAGLWLTACTYPVVVLVLPILFSSFGMSRGIYLLVAETFAPVAECALFWLAFRERAGAELRMKLRNFAVIVVANLLSFVVGELLNATRWFGLF